MNWILALCLQADKTPPPAPPPQDFWGQISGLAFPLVLCFVIIYFMLIRPQRRQMKERDVMLNAIRKNDEVVTSSGIIGRVHRITKEQEIVLEIDSKNEVQIRVLKSAIMTIRKKSGEEDEEAKPEDAEKTKQG